MFFAISFFISRDFFVSSESCVEFGRNNENTSTPNASAICASVFSLGQSRVNSMLFTVASETLDFSANANWESPCCLRIFFIFCDNVFFNSIGDIFSFSLLFCLFRMDGWYPLSIKLDIDNAYKSARITPIDVFGY